MANKVFLRKDEIIVQIYSGKQTFKRVVDISIKLMSLADTLRGAGKPVRILVSIKKVTDVEADAMLAAADAINDVPKAKIAIYGGRKFTNDLANLVIMATGREKSIQIFDSKTDALEWLKSNH